MHALFIAIRKKLVDKELYQYLIFIHAAAFIGKTFKNLF